MTELPKLKYDDRVKTAPNKDEVWTPQARSEQRNDRCRVVRIISQGLTYYHVRHFDGKIAPYSRRELTLFE